MKTPLVSVLSCVYNQREYVEDMLNGFLLQETAFDVEYIIHDDASVDGTQEILRAYQAQYPGKFHVIYQTENQWSKQVKIAQKILLPMARGKYIAFCEGDDYWIDRHKLQEQVDFLETHSDYVCVAHNALLWDCHKNKLYAQNNCETSREMTGKDIILRQWPSVATASRVFRKEAIVLEDMFLDCGMVGDMPTDFYAFSKGRIFYFDKIMSVYRYRSNGSYTQNIHKSIDNLIRWRIILINFLNQYNQYTMGKYRLYIQAYMTRGIHDILDRLIDHPMPKAEIASILERINMETAGKYAIGLKEIERQVDILIYGIDTEAYNEILNLSRDHKLYVYGAGKFGKVMAMQLQKKGIHFEGFLVTDVKDNAEFVAGKKVYSIDEYVNCDSNVILVSTGGKIWDQIYDTLEEHRISNYLYPLLAKMEY